MSKDTDGPQAAGRTGQPIGSRKRARTDGLPTPQSGLPQASILRAAYFPHILERIMAHSSLAALLVLRASSKYYKAKVDGLLGNGLHLVVTSTTASSAAASVRRLGHHNDQGVPSTPFLLALVTVPEFRGAINEYIASEIMGSCHQDIRAVRLPQYRGRYIRFPVSHTLVVSCDAYLHKGFDPPTEALVLWSAIPACVTKLVVNIGVNELVQCPTIDTRTVRMFLKYPFNVKELVLVFRPSDIPLRLVAPFPTVAGDNDSRRNLHDELYRCVQAYVTGNVRVTLVDCALLFYRRRAVSINEAEKEIRSRFRRAATSALKDCDEQIVRRFGFRIKVDAVLRFFTPEEYTEEVGDEQYQIETYID